jgi:hypothetical protein
MGSTGEGRESMSESKRFIIDDETARQDEKGEWVMYSDFAALRANLEREKDARKNIEDAWLRGELPVGIPNRIAEEINSLRQDLSAMEKERNRYETWWNESQADLEAAKEENKIMDREYRAAASKWGERCAEADFLLREVLIGPRIGPMDPGIFEKIATYLYRKAVK